MVVAADKAPEPEFKAGIPQTDVYTTPPVPVSASAGPRVLEGKAETVQIKDATAVGALGSQLYRQGAAALDLKKYSKAGELFQRAALQFEKAGLDSAQAQALFAAAQAVRLSGRTAEAAKLYQAAVDLFNEYDPLSPYLKAALDNLRKTAPALTGKVNRDEARLKALSNPKCIMTVDRNIVLKVGLSEFGSTKLLAEKATADVPKAFVDKTIHKAFVRMTCLETAELGSNSITAENRWYSLLAKGKTVAIPASSSFLAPAINVKINERFYNIPVDLPDLGSSKRTVFLLTDGMHIVAIDPGTEDMWSLIGNFSKAQPEFSWKKLSHEKGRKPK